MTGHDYCVGGQDGKEEGRWRLGGQGTHRLGSLRAQPEGAPVVQARRLKGVLEPSFSSPPTCKFIRILPSHCFLLVIHFLHTHHLCLLSPPE